MNLKKICNCQPVNWKVTFVMSLFISPISSYSPSYAIDQISLELSQHICSSTRYFISSPSPTKTWRIK